MKFNPLEEWPLILSLYGTKCEREEEALHKRQQKNGSKT